VLHVFFIVAREVRYASLSRVHALVTPSALLTGTHAVTHMVTLSHARTYALDLLARCAQRMHTHPPRTHHLIIPPPCPRALRLPSASFWRLAARAAVPRPLAGAAADVRGCVAARHLLRAAGRALAADARTAQLQARAAWVRAGGRGAPLEPSRARAHRSRARLAGCASPACSMHPLSCQLITELDVASEQSGHTRGDGEPSRAVRAPSLASEGASVLQREVAHRDRYK
jgi:hypothetical protein